MCVCVCVYIYIYIYIYIYHDDISVIPNMGCGNIFVGHAVFSWVLFRD